MLEMTSIRKSSAGDQQFLRLLAKEHGTHKEEEWHNNNSTIHQRAYVIDLDNISKAPVEIIRSLFVRNQQNGGYPLVAVPVAGFAAPIPRFSLLSCFSPATMEERLVEEYAKSFSLSPFTTAKHADLILRISKKAQRMKIITKGKETFFQASAGVRINDADDFLQTRGFALPPNMPTLHVASLVGAAANGCYGPGRDYGPMTTSIVEMKVINALGQRLKLSSKENADLFSIFRDCHLGVCFVEKITLKIQPKFLLKRHNILYRDVHDLTQKMNLKNPLLDEHFILMYIPVDIQEKEFISPRIMVTTFERTNESEKRGHGCKECKDLSAYMSLLTTEAGEPLIDLIVQKESLRHFYPFILKAGALKTFGKEEQTTEVDWSPSITHIFTTYTSSPIYDINWLIQVNNSDEAGELLKALLELTESHLKQDAEEGEYPLFNAFSRYLKGVSYCEGEGGIAATAVDFPHQSVLSFEFVTHSPLAETKAFKHLVGEVVKLLTDRGMKFRYHPGKNWPDNIHSLTQIFTDAIGKKRLKNFQEAVFKIHGGERNIPYSPFLTPQKKEFIGLSDAPKEKVLLKSNDIAKECTKAQEKEALKKIIQLAEEYNSNETKQQAQQQLEQQKH